jgi:hypothetical protein
MKSQRCQWDHKEKLKTVSARISASLHSKQYNVLSRGGEHFLWFDFCSIILLWNNVDHLNTIKNRRMSIFISDIRTGLAVFQRNN